tara:strand:- start:19 stop:609 length:591 start_codon:yes stop_codon:yes gene_type:complete
MPEYNSAPHTFQKDGIYYFNRRVPAVLRNHYTSPRISYSLRTRSKSVAASRAGRAAGQLDEYWFHLRSQDAELPGKHLLKMQGHHHSSQIQPQHDVKVANLSLSESVEVYLRLKGAGKGKTFIRAAQRSCGYVIDVCGDTVVQIVPVDRTSQHTLILVLLKFIGLVVPATGIDLIRHFRPGAPLKSAFRFDNKGLI